MANTRSYSALHCAEQPLNGRLGHKDHRPSTSHVSRARRNRISIPDSWAPPICRCLELAIEATAYSSGYGVSFTASERSNAAWRGYINQKNAGVRNMGMKTQDIIYLGAWKSEVQIPFGKAQCSTAPVASMDLLDSSSSFNIINNYKNRVRVWTVLNTTF